MPLQGYIKRPLSLFNWFVGIAAASPPVQCIAKQEVEKSLYIPAMTSDPTLMLLTFKSYMMIMVLTIQLHLLSGTMA